MKIFKFNNCTECNAMPRALTTRYLSMLFPYAVSAVDNARQALIVCLQFARPSADANLEVVVNVRQWTRQRNNTDGHTNQWGDYVHDDEHTR